MDTNLFDIHKQTLNTSYKDTEKDPTPEIDTFINPKVNTVFFFRYRYLSSNRNSIDTDCEFY